MKNINSCFVFLLFICVINTFYAQKPKKLFTSDETLKFTLTFNSKEVLKDKKTRDEHQAKLSHPTEDETDFTHNIKISVRGKSRTKICKFPPLKLNFKKKETGSTIFSKQNKLKLVTHCGNSDVYNEYVIKEYLIYKLYNVITPISINARLCEITYVDESNKKQSITKKGILLEDIEDVGKRNRLLEFDRDLRNQESLDKYNLDNLVFFQYLIGNLDWAIEKRHNVKILKDDGNGLPFGVPYDFDYSGFVNTLYAKPPEGFEIPNVKSRVFRGFCRSNNYKDNVDYYNSKKEQLYAIINEATVLDLKERNNLIDYLDDFYAILNNKKSFIKNVVKACRSEHKHVYKI